MTQYTARLTGVVPFNLQETFECGQCFRWLPGDDGSYTGVVGQNVITLRADGDDLLVAGLDQAEAEQRLIPYLALDEDYAAIQEQFRRNAQLAQAVDYARGIRVLRQDEWEMLVSFIISQRKSIPAIRRAVELLSERFGERLGSDSEGPVYAFPTAEALCCAGEQALQECGLGYRTRYVLHAAQQAAEGTLDLKKLASLPDEALFARLMELDGVGKKVANCVCLFGYGRVGRVPVDVWIERLIRDEFAGQDPFPQFGLEAGIVQQYLFFYKRSVG